MNNKYLKRLSNFGNSMEYADYLAENLENTIKYSEYIAENLDKSIEYAEYIAENLGGFSPYGKTKGQIIREQRKEKLDNIFGPTGIPGSSGCAGMSGTPGSSGCAGMSGYPGIDASTGGLAKDTWYPGNWMVEYAECHEIDELKSDVEIFEEYVKPKKVFKNMPILKELPILKDLPEIRRI